MTKTILYEQLPPALFGLIQKLEDEIVDLKKMIQEGDCNMAVSEAEFQQVKERIGVVERELASVQLLVETLTGEVAKTNALAEQVTTLGGKIETLESYDKNSAIAFEKLQTDIRAIEMNHVRLALSELTLPIIKIWTDLPLPKSDAYGSKITWTSSNPDVLSDQGVLITRPAASQGNMHVTMTASLAYGASSLTKPFIITILAKEKTDEEKLEEAVLLLDTSIFNGSIREGIVSISETQALPLEIEGYEVKWVSSNEAYLTSSGVVVRPVSEDVTLTLTATIHSGLESKDVVFTIVVLKEDAVVPEPEPEPEETEPDTTE